MYPIDCYSVENPDKIEAVRYFIYLNKELLKETSREEYELFAEFLKGEGKDIMAKIKDVKNQRELTILFNKIERALPYGASLAKVKGFESKISHLHRALAKVALGDDREHTARELLKMQRENAGEYDALIDSVGAYKDAVVVLRELKEKLADQAVVKQIFASGVVKGNVTDALKEAMEQKMALVKEKRNVAFGTIKDYYVKEQIYTLAHENMAER